MDEKTHCAEAGAALATEGNVRNTIQRGELIAALGGAASSWLAQQAAGQYRHEYAIEYAALCDEAGLH
jgi:hypothetical protein